MGRFRVSKKAAVATTTFTCFPFLPPELRQKIWRYTFEPRTIELMGPSAEVELQDHQIQRHSSGYHIHTSTLVPNVLRICHEARQEALRHYNIEHQCLHKVCLSSARKLYINWKIDIIHLVLINGVRMSKEVAARYVYCKTQRLVLDYSNLDEHWHNGWHFNNLKEMILRDIDYEIGINIREASLHDTALIPLNRNSMVLDGFLVLTENPPPLVRAAKDRITAWLAERSKSEGMERCSIPVIHYAWSRQPPSESLPSPPAATQSRFRSNSMTTYPRGIFGHNGVLLHITKREKVRRAFRRLRKWLKY